MALLQHDNDDAAAAAGAPRHSRLLYFQQCRPQRCLDPRAEADGGGGGGGGARVACALRYASQLASGLRALHDKGVARVCLDPGWCMVDGDGDAVIAEYGLRRSLRHLVDTRTCPRDCLQVRAGVLHLLCLL